MRLRGPTSDRVPGHAGDAGPVTIRRKAPQEGCFYLSCVLWKLSLMVGRTFIALGFQHYLNIAVQVDFACILLSIWLKHQKESFTPFQSFNYRNSNIQKKFHLLKYILHLVKWRRLISLNNSCKMQCVSNDFLQAAWEQTQEELAGFILIVSS